MTYRIADVWSRRTPHARGTAWPVRDQFLEVGVNEVDVEWGSRRVSCAQWTAAWTSR